MRFSNHSGRLRSRLYLKNKLSLRQAAVIFSLASFVLFCSWFAFFNVSQPGRSMAAVNGDYRSITSGNWNSIATWQKYQSGSWIAATVAPANTDGVVTIQNTHTVTITANINADQVIISSGGVLNLNPGIAITLFNGGGTDLDITGTFKNAGTVTINAGATIVYQNGGKYQHNYTTSPGIIPTATWNMTSTCEIIGYTGNNNAPGGLAQSFCGFTWNCPSQSSDIDLGGALTTVNGIFAINNTNGNELLLSTNGSILTVGNDFNITGGNLILAGGSSAVSTVNIIGNYNQSGGTFTVMDGSSASGTLNVSGNWSHTGGTLTVGGNSSTVAAVVFKKAGVQTFTASGNTVGLQVDFTINNGSTLVMGNNIMVGGDFTVSPGGTLSIGSANGISTIGPLGNIQVSGTRTYNTTANYIYAGTAAQVTGLGLPSTVNNLTINNSTGVTLTGSVNVGGILTLTSGKLTTGILNEVYITNTAPTGVTGNYPLSYVNGKLRRNITGTGTYDFPIGNATNPEPSALTFAGATGFTNVLATFTTGNPVTALLPLAGVLVNGLTIDKVLNYGYWTFTPNTPMTGGTYSVTVKEKGHTPPNAGRSYCVLKRDGPLSPWVSIGTHDYTTQSEVAGVVTAVRSGLTSFSDFAIGYGEYLQFKNPILLSGVDGEEGAVYKFVDICTDVDAWIEVLDINRAATLSDIDYFTAGYDEAWQPYISMGPNDTSSIKWKINFKSTGTNRDTILPYLAISAVDVDGDGSYLREYVEARYIYSYAVDPGTMLTIKKNNSNMSYRATSTVTNVPNIDTSQHHAMFQINYRNVATIFYETGAISNYSGTQIRQTCMYFKFFFSNNTVLPINLISFNAELTNKQEVNLTWVTSSEKNNDYFTIERSTDGRNFEGILNKKGAGTSNVMLSYHATDDKPLNGVSYYRLKQTDFNGEYTTSKIIAISNKGNIKNGISINSLMPSLFNDRFTIHFTSEYNDPVDFLLVNMAGQVVAKDRMMMQEGGNTYEFTDDHNLPPGIYMATLLYNDQKIVRKIIKQ